MATRVLAAAMVLGTLALSQGSALAQTAQTGDKAYAGALFDEGQKLIFAGRFAEACPKLAESQRLEPGIGTMLYLADCWAKTGRTASALSEFRLAQQLATKQGDKRATIAGQRADKLEPLVARLTISLPQESDAPGLEVRRDGLIIDRAQLKDGAPIDPGVHVITASAPRKRTWEARVQVLASLTVTVPPLEEADVPVASNPTAPIAPPVRDSSRGRTQRMVAIGGATLGVASAVAAAVLGVNAKSIYDSSDAHCAGGGCDAYGINRRNQGFETARLSTVAAIAGAALLGGAAVLYFSAPHSGTLVGVTAAPTTGGASAGAIVHF